MATYNWDIGTIQRPNEEERQFEVASHQLVRSHRPVGRLWCLLFLTDCKNASDKPDDKTLRLTLVRTPGTRGGYADQGTQDLGRHENLVRYRRARAKIGVRRKPIGRLTGSISR